MRTRRNLPMTIRSLSVFCAAVVLVAACSGASSDDTAEAPESNVTPVATISPEPAENAAGADNADTEGETAPDASADETALEPETDDAAPAAAAEPADVASLLSLLPSDTRSVFVIDVGTLLASDSSIAVEALLQGDGADPAVAEMFGRVGTLTQSIDRSGTMTNALLAQTADAGQGSFVVAALRSGELDQVVAGSAPTPDGNYGPADRALYLDDAGNQLALLEGGVLVAGSASAVQSVIDVADGSTSGGENPLAPFFEALDPAAHVGFVHGLPALFTTDIEADLTLESASAATGSLTISDGSVSGNLNFHSSTAATFVETYNQLNEPSTKGDDPLESPLTVGAPVVDGLDQVVIPLEPLALDASDDEVFASRNLFRKLFVGMHALDYAEQVADRSEPAWLDFVVLSEVDQVTPASPGSVYIRWEFRDEAAIRAFEQNELPAGFRLAPTRFVESDDPEGEYFFALNLYNAGGGSIVGGTRAEWDVFAHGPDGADPNAGERPRFMVVDVLSEEVSADSLNLLTTAEPLSHELNQGMVVSSVARFEDGVAVPVFESSFPVPDPATAEVARFTREMAIGNDYIYWAYGVSDRVLYNATTFNHDAYFVDTSQLTFTDLSRWAEYLQPEVKDAVYYHNTLNYVASPMANLDSEFLDIEADWLQELVSFTTNGHQDGLMRGAVAQLFRGEADPFVGVNISNEVPSTYFNFEITDPTGFEAAIDLPPGHSIAPISLFEGGPASHWLTLSVLDVDGAAEGTRGEWSVYTDDGSGRPPHQTIIELMTSEIAFDPIHILNLPSQVEHDLADSVLSTQLSSGDVRFLATLDVADTAEQPLSLDWIESGDIVCHINGVCDNFYYDAETLDVPVNVAADVTIGEFVTPWDEFVDTAEPVVFYRDNAQEYAVKRWYSLDVAVAELPFSGLDNATHTVSGSGSLAGRTNDVVDSDYTYSGDVVLEEERVTFAIDQEITNALGVANIFTTGSFDIATASGTQTVVNCIGPALMCSNIENGSTAFYTAQELDASDLDAISWHVGAVVDLGGSFGTADSDSTFVASRNVG